MVGLLPCSVRILTSIDANPKIAFVGKPVEVAIDSGSAKNARYARLLPSIRKSSRDPLPATADTLRRAAVVLFLALPAAPASGAVVTATTSFALYHKGQGYTELR